MSYATFKAIRRMAGVHSLKKNETPTGLVNGSNKAFNTQNFPLVDNNGDDITTATDVIVFVNDVLAAVDLIDSAAGVITLATAPPNGASIRVNYTYSTVDDSDVAAVRLEAEGWLNSRIAGKVDTSANGWTAPPVFSTITVLWAAGLIQIRDYGSSADTDESSKDGYKKLKTAKEMLSDYLGDTVDDDDPDSLNAVVPTVATDGNIFRRDTDLTEHGCVTADEEFFHKDN